MEPEDEGVEDCPTCKGDRFELVDGEKVLCTNCNGAGFIAPPVINEHYED